MAAFSKLLLAIAIDGVLRRDFKAVKWELAHCTSHDAIAS
jgi:hypothetical protein